jgi:O-antigen ligase
MSDEHEHGRWRRTGNDPLTRTAALVAVALVAALAVTVFVTAVLEPRLAGRPRLALVLQVKLFVTSFTVVTLIALAGTYLSLYRRLPNPFTLSLVVFCVALLLYALTSNPLVPAVLGFRPTPFGPFTFLPDLFAAVAVVVLLYQSQR